MPKRPVRFPLAHAVAPWLSKVALLTTENFGFRYSRSRWDDILSILEPIAIILVITLVHSLASPLPPYGPSNLLFAATGILPFYQFMHLLRRTQRMDTLVRQPRVTEFDSMLSHLLAEIIVKALLVIVVLSGLYAYGIDAAIPAHPLRCFAAMATLAVMGLGVGMVIAVGTSFWFELRYVWKPFFRVLIFFSGIMNVMDYTPMPMAKILEYNPISHGVAWFRSGVYPDFPVATMNLPYLFTCTCVLLATGLVLEATTKEWRRLA